MDDDLDSMYKKSLDDGTSKLMYSFGERLSSSLSATFSSSIMSQLSKQYLAFQIMTVV